MSSTLKAVLAEDESVLRAELRELLVRLWPELVICAEAEDGIEAIRAFERHAPDILFLDIEMPGMTGIEVAQQLAAKVHIVFVTAYDKFALAAFEHGAVDYVLKPFSAARLMTTVARLKQKVKSAPANLDGFLRSLAQATAPREYIRWLTVAHGTELQLVTLDEICYIAASNDGVRVVTADSQSTVDRTIAELAAELDPSLFVPLDAATLVNVSAIAGLRRNANGRTVVSLKQRTETLTVDQACETLVARAAGLAGHTRDEGRQLATVLFTDIVESTATAARLGDEAWRVVLLEHDRLSRQIIERFHGRWIKSTGDGVLATFDAPARAIRCAQAIGAEVKRLGVNVRAAVHTGECEMHGGDVRGIAVHIGARIAGLAGADEVLVSATVRDLVGGAGFAFADRGQHALKGIPNAIHVLIVHER
ncbi:MAG TPA: response regulator [Casimicrobiaceae bacterium]